METRRPKTPTAKAITKKIKRTVFLPNISLQNHNDKQIKMLLHLICTG
ncbi:MAG TPA: hypothetical protein VIP70_11810 [Nitrososphaeraceae archaeon]